MHTNDVMNHSKANSTLFSFAYNTHQWEGVCFHTLKESCHQLNKYCWIGALMSMTSQFLLCYSLLPQRFWAFLQEHTHLKYRLQLKWWQYVLLLPLLYKYVIKQTLSLIYCLCCVNIQFLPDTNTGYWYRLPVSLH